MLRFHRILRPLAHLPKHFSNVRMSSTITGDSGRIYTNSTLLRKHPQHSKYDIYKVKFVPWHRSRRDHALTKKADMETRVSSSNTCRNISSTYLSALQTTFYHPNDFACIWIATEMTNFYSTLTFETPCSPSFKTTQLFHQMKD